MGCPLGSVSEADWHVIDAPVSRHYREATPPMSPVVYKSVQIGPDTTVPGYFTIIDPVLPASGEDWEVLDEGYDLASAYYATTALAPGKCVLRICTNMQVFLDQIYLAPAEDSVGTVTPLDVSRADLAARGFMQVCF